MERAQEGYVLEMGKDVEEKERKRRKKATLKKKRIWKNETRWKARRKYTGGTQGKLNKKGITERNDNE